MRCLREAAYQLQLPGGRVRLHALALEMHGGRPPEPSRIDAIDPPKFTPHPTDSVAIELAEHVYIAIEGEAGFAEVTATADLAGTRELWSKWIAGSH